VADSHSISTANANRADFVRLWGINALPLLTTWPADNNCKLLISLTTWTMKNATLCNTMQCVKSGQIQILPESRNLLDLDSLIGYPSISVSRDIIVSKICVLFLSGFLFPSFYLPVFLWIARRVLIYAQSILPLLMCLSHKIFNLDKN